MENSKLNAFPIVLQHGLSHDSHVEIGLTKREYFAGLMLQGLISNSASDSYALNETDITDTAENKVKFCILLADELLKQLSNE